jgi:hypothetical protein
MGRTPGPFGKRDDWCAGHERGNDRRKTMGEASVDCRREGGKEGVIESRVVALHGILDSEVFRAELTGTRGRASGKTGECGLDCGWRDVTERWNCGQQMQNLM